MAFVQKLRTSFENGLKRARTEREIRDLENTCFGALSVGSFHYVEKGERRLSEMQMQIDEDLYEPKTFLERAGYRVGRAYSHFKLQ